MLLYWHLCLVYIICNILIQGVVDDGDARGAVGKDVVDVDQRIQHEQDQNILKVKNFSILIIYRRHSYFISVYISFCIILNSIFI